MRVAPTLALLVLSACAAPSREAQLSSSTNRSEALCWWREVRWEDRGPLLVRGTGLPLGRAKATRGPTFTGTLRRAGHVVLLQGRWEGEGLSLDAEVDVGTDAVLTSWEPRRIGSVGLLLKGARVRVLDANVGSVLAVPGDAALSRFRPAEPLAIALSCENVTLRGGEETPERQLQLAGFSPLARRVRITPGFPLELAPQPTAPIAGVLRSEPATYAYEVKREGADSRIVVPTDDGVLWVGWVESARLQDVGATLSLEPQPSRALTAAAPNWRQCNQSLAVAVRVDGEVTKVGLLSAGTSFALSDDVSTVDEWVPAQLGVEWFAPDDGVHVLLPGEARRCNAVNQTW